MTAAPYAGAYGTAEPIPYQYDQPDAAETLTAWLLTAPGWHPAWSQYQLLVVRLRDAIPGFPEPTRQFPEATHELLVIAVDPTDGPWTGESFARAAEANRPPILTPVNIAEQFEATDDEMTRLAEACAHAVADGRLCPETGDAPTYIRTGWRHALTQTLAHLRGAHT